MDERLIASVPEIVRLERVWIGDRALKSAHIDWSLERRIDYALRLARLTKLRLDNGHDLDLTEDVADFRVWLTTALQRARTAQSWDAYGLAPLDLPLKERLADTRTMLLQKYSALSSARLDQELCKKKLALALGGGGGTGFAHLPVFQILEELGHCPDFIVGTSLGALMGYYRAIKKKYDPAAAYLQLPQWIDITRSIRPFLGGSRHGMPALFNVNLSPIINKLNLLRQAPEAPSFEELEIPFACVATGVKRGANDAELLIEQKRSAIPRLLSLGLFPWRKTLGAVLTLSQFLSSHPDLISEQVLGLDPLTQQLCAIDAIAFSSLVPSLLTYEVPSNHHRSREILDTLFNNQALYRFVDGGLSNNVPARVAFQAAEQGRLGSRNTFILAVDVFAPSAKINALFMPLQQIANHNTLLNLPFADTYSRLRHLLSPVNLAPSLRQLTKLSQNVHTEMQESIAMTKYALKTLPHYEQIQ